MRVTTGICLFLAVALPQAARALPQPCTIHPADGTAENGFAPGNGEHPRTFCSQMAVPASDAGLNCLWGDYFYVDAVGAGFTATGSVTDSPVQVEARADALGLPGDPLDGFPVVDGNVPPPPLFPSFQENFYDRYAYTFYGRYVEETSHHRTVESSFWACTHRDVGVARGYITVDTSGSTPFNPCFTGVNGGPINDPCTDGDPNLRAIGIFAQVSPIAGIGSGADVAPPTPSASRAHFRAWYTDTPTFTVRIDHDVASPSAAHIHLGQPGENGPVVVDLGTPTSPIVVSGISLTGPQVTDLSRNQLYFDIHSPTYPGGEVRGQIYPAQPPIFADGFQSGDTSAWSTTVP